MTEQRQLLREGPDRAEDTATHRRRELRGKAAPKTARPAAEVIVARPFPSQTAKEGLNPKKAPAYMLRNPAKLDAVSQHNKNMQAKRYS